MSTLGQYLLEELENSLICGTVLLKNDKGFLFYSGDPLKGRRGSDYPTSGLFLA